MQTHTLHAAHYTLHAAHYTHKHAYVCTLVLGGMAFFILVFSIEKTPRYLVFHGVLAVN